MSSVALLVDAVSHHSAPVVKVTAVAAATTGVLAATTLTANAAPASGRAPVDAPATTTTQTLPIVVAPAAFDLSSSAFGALAAQPAPSAVVTTAAPAAAATFGEMTFTSDPAVAEAERKAKEAERAAQAEREARAAARAERAAQAEREARAAARAERAARAQRAAERAARAEQVAERSRQALQSSRSSARYALSASDRDEASDRNDQPQRHSSSGGVAGLAQRYSGIYYVWGGTTPEGFDCSGFTQYLYGRLGVSLPRTAEDQRQAVTQVSEPQVGDLVFFGAPAFHVGIYAGDGMMYDAPRTGKATGLHPIWSSNVTYGRP